MITYTIVSYAPMVFAQASNQSKSQSRSNFCLEGSGDVIGKLCIPCNPTSPAPGESECTLSIFPDGDKGSVVISKGGNTSHIPDAVLTKLQEFENKGKLQKGTVQAVKSLQNGSFALPEQPSVAYNGIVIFILGWQFGEILKKLADAEDDDVKKWNECVDGGGDVHVIRPGDGSIPQPITGWWGCTPA